MNRKIKINKIPINIFCEIQNKSLFLTKTSRQICTNEYYNIWRAFPDRSPRPIIGFKTLSNWNKKNRRINHKHLIVDDEKDKDALKLKLLNDWQDFLAEEWMSIILSGNKTKSEKWFNKALRKFAIKLLTYSKNQNEDDLEKLIADLIHLCK